MRAIDNENDPRILRELLKLAQNHIKYQDDLIKKYILENVSIKVNNKLQTINYLSKEMEGNVVICYFNIKNISKIKTFEIQNTALLELNEEQQNIMQLNIFNKKENILFTINNVKALLKP